MHTGIQETEEQAALTQILSHTRIHTTNLCCNVEVVNEKTTVYFLDSSPEVLVCLIVEDDGGIGLAPVLPYPSIF